MIQIAHFTERFFVDLVKYLNLYGELYITEDGNIYRQEHQAARRAQTKEKLAHLNSEDVQELRWCKVTRSKFPRNAEDMEKMMEEQFKERRNAGRKSAAEAVAPEPIPTMSDEEAMRILKGEAPKETEAPEEPILVGEKQVPFSKVRDAIRKTVNPKLHQATGFEKTEAAYEALTDEEKAQVAAAITE